MLIMWTFSSAILLIYAIVQYRARSTTITMQYETITHKTHMQIKTNKSIYAQ